MMTVHSIIGVRPVSTPPVANTKPEPAAEPAKAEVPNVAVSSAAGGFPALDSLMLGASPADSGSAAAHAASAPEMAGDDKVPDGDADDR